MRRASLPLMLLLLTLALALLPAPQRASSAQPPRAPGQLTITGEYHVTGTEVWENKIIIFEQTYAGEARLIVDEGASLTIRNSVLNSSNGLRYYIQVYGKLVIEDSVVDLAGTGFGSYGDTSGIYGLGAEIALRNVTVRRAYIGVFASSSALEVEDCRFESFSSYGAVFYNGSSGSVVRSSFSSPGGTGIWIWASDGVEVVNSTLEDLSVGVSVSSSDNVTVRGTIVRGAEDYGVAASFSDWLRVENSTVSSCGTGIAILHSEGGEVTKSVISSCDTGLYINDTDGLVIHRNSFEGNGVHAVNDGDNSFNSTFGNYWGGFQAEDSDGDGFLDQPYNESGALDRRPLALPPGVPKNLSVWFVPESPSNNGSTLLVVSFFDDGAASVSVVVSVSAPNESRQLEYSNETSFPARRVLVYNLSRLPGLSNVSVLATVADDEGNLASASVGASIPDVVPPEIASASMEEVNETFVRIWVVVVDEYPSAVWAEYSVVDSSGGTHNGSGVLERENETHYFLLLNLTELGGLNWSVLSRVVITVHANDTSGNASERTFELEKPQEGGGEGGEGAAAVAATVAVAAAAGAGFLLARRGKLPEIGERVRRLAGRLRGGSPGGGEA